MGELRRVVKATDSLRLGKALRLVLCLAGSRAVPCRRLPPKLATEKLLQVLDAIGGAALSSGFDEWTALLLIPLGSCGFFDQNPPLFAFKQGGVWSMKLAAWSGLSGHPLPVVDSSSEVRRRVIRTKNEDSEKR